LPLYWSRMQDGVVNLAAAFEVVRREASTALTGAHDDMIEWHLRAGLPIQQEWALTAEGERTEAAATGMLGTLFPLGGPKGFAMAVMIDGLTGVLTGSAFGPSVFDSPRHDVGHLVIAIATTRFLPPTPSMREWSPSSLRFVPHRQPQAADRSSFLARSSTVASKKLGASASRSLQRSWRPCSVWERSFEFL
jgi:LDH2 family malate/lactate/ureidoglycolate dehydrogenase